MKENPTPSFEKTFAALTEGQQFVCFYLVVEDWQTGYDLEHLINMGDEVENVSKIVEELVSQGIVTKDEDNQFVAEYLEQNQDNYKEVTAKLGTIIQLTLAERSFLSRYKRAQELVANNTQKSEPRYRLHSQAFFNFVNAEMNKMG